MLTVSKNLDEVLSQLKHTDNFADGTLKHIFSGEISKNSKKAVGFHYEGLSGVEGEVIQITKQPNKYGIYEATVKINGKNKDRISTFFPKNWTPQQVVDAINEAFDNKKLVSGNLYEGTTKTGMKIQMSIISGKITSTWPLYN